MIDDTGPRITALERRVAALESEAVRFADLRAVLVAIRDMGAPNSYSDGESVNRGDITDGCDAIDRIEDARAARSDIRSAGAPVTVYPGEGIEVTVRGGGGAAREDSSAGVAPRKGCCDSGTARETEPDNGGKPDDGTKPAPSPSSPTLAEAMEAMRRFPYWPEVVAVLAAWDRSKAAIVEADDIERKWKARAEAGDRVLEQLLLWWRAEEELSMSDIVEKIRAHLQKGTP